MDASSQSNVWFQSQGQLQLALPDFLKARRWFGGKTRVIRSVEIADTIPIPRPGLAAAIIVARVNYAEGPSEIYTVPLLEESSSQQDQPAADASLLRIRGSDGTERIFSDALASQPILETLFDAIREGRRLMGGRAGEILGVSTRALEPLRIAADGKLRPSLMKTEQSNTSVLYGRAFVLKLFRRLEMGLSPDFEVGLFLSERAAFRNVPPMAGALEYRSGHSEPAAMAILQGFVANQGDVWEHTLKALSGYYDRVAAANIPAPPKSAGLDGQLLGNYPAEAALLGQRTAELHGALASDRNDPNFAPEPFSLAHQREISESMVYALHEIFGMLRRRLADLPDHAQAAARRALASEKMLAERFRSLAGLRLTGPRMRIHGDLHLGQVLFTGDDFVFIDFEGEPARTLAERREKHSPLRDVAGMVRSFHYAAYAALFGRCGAPLAKSQQLVAFANAWYRAACDEYLLAYFATAAGAAFLPADSREREFLLNFWLLGKAVYELKYELNHRLDWVAIPLEGIDMLIGGPVAS